MSHRRPSLLRLLRSAGPRWRRFNVKPRANPERPVGPAVEAVPVPAPPARARPVRRGRGWRSLLATRPPPSWLSMVVGPEATPAAYEAPYVGLRRTPVSAT